MTEGIAFGDGKTASRAYLGVGLMGETEIQLSIYQLIHSQVKTGVNTTLDWLNICRGWNLKFFITTRVAMGMRSP